MVRLKLVDPLLQPDVASLRLKQLFSFDTEQALKFFVGVSVICNKAFCEKCGYSMTIEKRGNRVDGLQWRCRKK